ncbi:cupin domain-containing protein [Halobacteriovorax sp. RT-2-6]|uniref:(R)-mandelonitrile lyase n=1 Tax=unclassified Halobacteriovorax TaxID=2639665 RepID=UPI003999ED0A
MKNGFVLTLILSLGLMSCSGITNANGEAQGEKKLMEITPTNKTIKFDSSSPVFTGNVLLRPLFETHDTSDLTGGEVTFSKNARSAWHTHPKGQLLVVTKGQGVVQQWGEKARVMKAGDIVWTPAGVKHWHGADNKNTVTHLALQEKKNGKNVIWMEKVSDKQYKDGLRSIRSKK